MVDLREEVAKDRGLIKKIELAIPGFRGYRKREDLRIADRLLREQLALRLKNASSALEGARRAISRRQLVEYMEDLGRLVSLTGAAEARVRHAEQGYTGVSPDYRIEEAELNQMYEWDLHLLARLDEMCNGSERLLAAAEGSDQRELSKQLKACDAALLDFNQVFDKRRESIANLGVA
jgi:hypothetical protein